MKILLGPAGSPAKSTLEGIKVVNDLGLQAMEVAFTHGVRMGNRLAREIKEENKKYNISLSIHAPYYINLTSEDARKIKDSKQRILDTCERGHHMGARKIIFHVAYYGKLSKEETYSRVRQEVEEIMESIKEKKWNVELLPETAGRLAQFGDLDEIIQLSRETKCGICVDPAHLYARGQGTLDFSAMFDKMRELKQMEMHFHFSSIAFGPRGERNHLVLKENKPPFSEFMKELLARKISATIICESPITWQDSLNMKHMLQKEGHVFDYLLKDSG